MPHKWKKNMLLKTEWNSSGYVCEGSPIVPRCIKNLVQGGARLPILAPPVHDKSP